MTKKDNQEQTTQHFVYKVEHSSVTYITRESDINNQWDGDDLQTTWNVGSTLTEEKGDHYDVVVPFKLNCDEQHYLVYAVYSSGNSFHRHEGAEIEFIDVFKNKEKADDLVDLIRKHNKSYDENQATNQKDYSLQYIDEVGNKKQLNTPWNGYFNNLETVETIEVFNRVENQLKNTSKKM